VSCCSHCDATADFFGPKIAERDLERYRRRGPDATARLLLDAVRDHLRTTDTVLDVGAGIGLISFEILAQGAASTTLVDASPAYLEAAARAAEARGLTDRVRGVRGDFTRVSATIEDADVVAMHRVVCCYPDHRSLLRAAARRSRRVLACSYPRDRWFIRLRLWVENALRRLRGNGFRTFVHPPAEMDGVLRGEGFRRATHAENVAWSIEVYVRVDPAPHG